MDDKLAALSTEHTNISQSKSVDPFVRSVRFVQTSTFACNAPERNGVCVPTVDEDSASGRQRESGGFGGLPLHTHAPPVRDAHPNHIHAHSMHECIPRTHARVHPPQLAQSFHISDKTYKSNFGCGSYSASIFRIHSSRRFCGKSENLERMDG